MTENTLEQQAIEFGNNPVLVEQRVRMASELLEIHLNRGFKYGKYDADSKTLWSDDGKMGLRWALRNNPTKPISENNQQTKNGAVIVTLPSRSV